MKKLIAFAALALAAVQADASSVLPNSGFRAVYVLRKFELAKNTSLVPRGSAYAGTISVNDGTKTLRLTLHPSSYCPAGMFCTTVMPKPVSHDLKLLRVGTGSCGGKIVTAEVNRLPVDGVRLHVQIVDDSTSPCMHQLGRYPVTVRVLEQFPRGFDGKYEARSTMYGEPAR